MTRRKRPPLPTAQRVKGWHHPHHDALACEHRPEGRVASVEVWHDGRRTIAAAGDWALSRALVAAYLELIQRREAAA